MMIEMNSIIKQKLTDFFGDIPHDYNGSFMIHVGPTTSGFDVEFVFHEDKIIVNKVLPNIDNEKISILLQEIPQRDDIRYDIDQGWLNIVFKTPEPSKDLDALLTILREIYKTFIRLFPTAAWRDLGEINVESLGYEITILSPEYREPIKTGWRNDIIVVMPTNDAWFITNFGKDHVKLPLLSVSIDSKIIAYAPSQENTLVPINLTDILKRVREISQDIGSGFIRLPKDEIDLLLSINELLSLLDMIKASMENITLPLSPVSFKVQDKRKLKNYAEELLKIIETLRRVNNLNELIRRRLAIRLSIELARKMIAREKGVIVSNVRKVSKLGAGRAVYIGKEELKVLPLGEKVLVSVVDDKGKKKIIIEPL